MPRPIVLTISPEALTHNLDVVRQRLQHSADALGRAAPKVWAVIKANAYGHGIQTAVPAFFAADGLAMLDFEEALLCRQLGWQKPLLLLEGFFNYDDLSLVAAHDLSLVLHQPEQLEMLSRFASRKPLKAYLKINTGMNRLGFTAATLPQAWAQLQTLINERQLDFLGAMTHFSWADESAEATRAQIETFLALNPAPQAAFSVCNSAATLHTQWQALLPATEQWVRPGICLYGASPFVAESAAQLDLQPAQTLSAEIISIQELDAGQVIGYGHTFTARGPMRIGVVACGYADGYPRHAPSGTPAVVAGQRTELVGRISMDMLTIDVTHIPAAGVGSQVHLWGAGGPSVDEVAQHAGTIGYELVTAVTPRVPRQIIQS